MTVEIFIQLLLIKMAEFSHGAVVASLTTKASAVTAIRMKLRCQSRYMHSKIIELCKSLLVDITLWQ